MHHSSLSKTAFFCLMLSLSACADGLTDLSIPTGDSSKNYDTASKSDGTSKWTQDSNLFSFLGDGSLGGMRLISGVNDYNCVGYPVSDRALLTLTECVEECSQDEVCDTAVIAEGLEPKYYGLISQMRVIPHPNGGEADDRLVLVEVDSPQAWKVYSVSDSRLAPHNYEGSKTILSSTDTTLTVLSSACDPSSNGLFNQSRELIGLSPMSPSCDQYVDLGPWRDSIAAAIQGDGEPLPREVISIQDEEQEEPSETNREENQRNEIQWQGEEEEAMSRAPSSCTDRETYCDGDIEMRCSNGSYTTFNCAKVGWICGNDENFGDGCVPAE